MIQLVIENVLPIRNCVNNTAKLLVVYPNPASNYLIAYYTLPEAASGARLIVSNTSGIVLQEVSLTLIKNQVTIPLQNLISGNYILTLKTDKKVIESVSFNVMK